MRKIVTVPLLILLTLVFSSCVSVNRGNDFSGPAGRGDHLFADSMEMTAPKNWEDRAALAEFVPGVIVENVEAVEFQAGYGETTVGWNFSGFPPGSEIRISHDVNADLFETDTVMSFAYLSGLYTAKDALGEREEIIHAVVHKWADSDPVYADTTDGWKTVSCDLQTDSNGEASVLMILGRASDDPPVVFGYFTNPKAEILE